MGGQYTPRVSVRVPPAAQPPRASRAAPLLAISRQGQPTRPCTTICRFAGPCRAASRSTGPLSITRHPTTSLRPGKWTKPVANADLEPLIIRQYGCASSFGSRARHKSGRFGETVAEPEGQQCIGELLAAICSPRVHRQLPRQKVRRRIRASAMTNTIPNNISHGLSEVVCSNFGRGRLTSLNGGFNLPPVAVARCSKSV
jgi:hypothetical protein